MPYPICTWQFNFKWDKDKEKIVEQSYELLQRAGVRFDKLVTDGIEFQTFAEYFTGSSNILVNKIILGFILNKKTKWVVFHGSSDFAYLLRLVLGEELPNTIDDFYKSMKQYFPNIYDLKYIIKDVPSLKDVGLAKVSY